MKPRLVVHIGTHKTGTASIQQALTSARARMRRDCGILFASTERGMAHTRHASVSRAAGSLDSDADTEYRALMDDFARSGAKGMLITDEGLSTGQVRMANFFKRFTNDFDLHVICYLRRQDLFVEALHNSLMRSKSGRGVPPVADLWREPYMSRRLEYDRWLGTWANIATRLTVLDFKTAAANGGLIPSFLKAAELTALGGLRDPNISETADVRMLHLLGLLSVGDDKTQIRAVSDGLRRSARTLAGSGAFPMMKASLGRIERARLLASYAQNNERLEQKFGVRFDDELPTEGDEPVTQAPGDYVVGLLGDLTITDALLAQRCAQAYMAARAAGPKATAPRDTPAATEAA
jgi:hypothetical protein